MGICLPGNLLDVRLLLLVMDRLSRPPQHSGHQILHLIDVVVVIEATRPGDSCRRLRTLQGVQKWVSDALESSHNSTLVLIALTMGWLKTALKTSNMMVVMASMSGRARSMRVPFDWCSTRSLPTPGQLF